MTESYFSSNTIYSYCQDFFALAVIKKFFDEGVYISKELLNKAYVGSEGEGLFVLQAVLDELFLKVSEFDSFSINVIVVDKDKLSPEESKEADIYGKKLKEKFQYLTLKNDDSQYSLYLSEECLLDFLEIENFITELFEAYKFSSRFHPRDPVPKAEITPRECLSDKVLILIDGANQIKLFSKEGPVLRKSSISPFRLMNLFHTAFESDGTDIKYTFWTPVLPKGTVCYKQTADTSQFVISIVVEGRKRPFNYYKDRYIIPFPDLLFTFKVVGIRLAESYVVAVKDSVIRDDTQLYRYPFSNVWDNGSICWGVNEMGPIKQPIDLEQIIEQFFCSPSNDDLNFGSVPLRQKLEELKEQEFFPTGKLLPLDKDFQTFFSEL